MEQVELPQVEQQCGNCRFWQPLAWEKNPDDEGRDPRDVYATCRRFPPHLIQATVEHRAKSEGHGDELEADRAWQWESPRTYGDDWCGEWQARKPKPGEPIAEYTEP